MIPRLATDYLIRFRWEILLYAVASSAATASLLASSNPDLAVYLSWLEILALAWVTARLFLAEDLLRMNGGWRTRPIPARDLRNARVLIIAGVAGIPVLARAIALKMFLDPVSDAWIWLLVWRQSVIWIPALVTFALISRLVIRGFRGKGATLGAGTLALVFLGITLMVLARMPGGAGGGRGGHFAPGDLARGIAASLPPTADRIGDWWAPPGQSKPPQARLVTRIELDDPGSAAHIRVAALRASIEGPRVSIHLRILTGGKGTFWRQNTVPILRYANGIHASSIPGASFSYLDHAIPFSGIREFTFAGTFVSPLSLPESEVSRDDLLKGAEILFFAPDYSLPPLPPADKTEAPVVFQLPPAESSSDDAAEYILRFLAWAEPEYIHKSDLLRAKLRAENMDPRFLPVILQAYPWSANGWNRVVRPYLSKRLAQEELPLLASKMEGDPRLASFLCEKGWVTEAMPLLTEQVKNRVAMDIPCLEALAHAGDSSLAPDLAAVALQLDDELPRIAPLLRGFPGFDWPAFVREGWKRAKYSSSRTSDRTGQFAVWAAEEGDASALRFLAVMALHPLTSSSLRTETLSKLLAGDPPDLQAYVRENIDRLAFDQTTRRWRRMAPRRKSRR